MKTYGELLEDYREARARVQQAHAEWDTRLPSQGIRLVSHPELRAMHDAIVAAEQAEADARKALMDYRGD